MNAAGRYFRNIRNAVTTTFTGMKITLRYWLREPAITVEYPDRLGKGVSAEDLVADRYRGFLEFIPAKCIGCMQCMQICPIACIRVTVEKRQEARMLTRFGVNQAKCMHCGLCVEICPTQALVFTRRFEGARYDIRDLCIEHITAPVPVARLRKDERG